MTDRLPTGLTPEQDTAFEALARAIAAYYAAPPTECEQDAAFETLTRAVDAVGGVPALPCSRCRSPQHSPGTPCEPSGDQR